LEITPGVTLAGMEDLDVKAMVSTMITKQETT